MTPRLRTPLSLLVAGLLVAAPLTATAALADEQASGEVAASAPAEVAPAEVAASPPAEVAPAEVAASPPAEVAPAEVEPVEPPAPIEAAADTTETAPSGETDVAEDGIGARSAALEAAPLAEEAPPVVAPGAPRNISIYDTNIGHDFYNIVIDWDAPLEATADTTYTVDFLGNGYDHVITPGLTDTRLVLQRGLGWPANAQVTITAANSAGSGPAASRYQSLTLRSPAPQNVAAEVIPSGTGFALRSSWSPSHARNYYSYRAVSGSGAVVSGNVTAEGFTRQLPEQPRGTTWDLVLTTYRSGYTDSTTITGIRYPATAADAPTDLTAARVTLEDSIDVSWSAPRFDGNAAITGYRVTWNDETGAHGGSFPTDQTAARLIGVTAGHIYSISVVAENGVGASTAATASLAFPVQPADAPRELQARAAEGYGIEVAWSFPAYYGGEEPSGYVVRVASGEEVVEVTTGPFEYRALVEVAGLPGTSYEVAVHAVNSGGPGAKAGTRVEFPTLAPSAPEVRASAVGFLEPGIRVEWTPGSDGGSPITGWTVGLLGAGGVVAVVELDAAARSHTFDGLDAGADHLVLVLPVNANGTGSAGFASVTTHGMAPAAPQLPTDGSLGDTRVIVVDGVAIATVAGAEPGQWLFAHVFSTPSALGWAQVAADGTAHWTLPADLAPGIHHLALTDDTGSLVSSTAFTIVAPVLTPPVTAPVPTPPGTSPTEITPAAAPAAIPSTESTADSLARTGAEGGQSALLAAMLLLAGLALVVARRSISARD